MWPTPWEILSPIGSFSFLLPFLRAEPFSQRALKHLKIAMLKILQKCELKREFGLIECEQCFYRRTDRLSFILADKSWYQHSSDSSGCWRNFGVFISKEKWRWIFTFYTRKNPQQVARKEGREQNNNLSGLLNIYSDYKRQCLQRKMRKTNLKTNYFPITVWEK